jgi:hypothetical protein
LPVATIALPGTARAKAEGWLGQRQSIAEQLTNIRDTAADLLQQLTGDEAFSSRHLRKQQMAAIP